MNIASATSCSGTSPIPNSTSVIGSGRISALPICSARWPGTVNASVASAARQRRRRTMGRVNHDECARTHRAVDRAAARRGGAVVAHRLGRLDVRCHRVGAGQEWSALMGWPRDGGRMAGLVLLPLLAALYAWPTEDSVRALLIAALFWWVLAAVWIRVFRWDCRRAACCVAVNWRWGCCCWCPRGWRW